MAGSGNRFPGGAFFFAVTFFPPSQLPVGSPAFYTSLVVIGTVVFFAMPFVISFAMDKREAKTGFPVI